MYYTLCLTIKNIYFAGIPVIIDDTTYMICNNAI